MGRGSGVESGAIFDSWLESECHVTGPICCISLMCPWACYEDCSNEAAIRRAGWERGYESVNRVQRFSSSSRHGPCCDW